MRKRGGGLQRQNRVDCFERHHIVLCLENTCRRRGNLGAQKLHERKSRHFDFGAEFVQFLRDFDLTLLQPLVDYVPVKRSVIEHPGCIKEPKRLTNLGRIAF